MAEAVGLASSIVALVQLSASVYSATSKFYREAKEAKSKIGALATQTRNLSGVLQSLSLLASSPLFDDAGVSAPDFRDTYIESCHNTLHKIKRRLEKAGNDFDSGSHRKHITRSLKWPFASQETNDLITELSHHHDVLHLALSAETMSHLLQCLANTNSIAKSVDRLNRKLERKESIDTRAELTAKREEIVRFFLKVNPEEHLQDCRSRRQPNTGKWLIERDQTFRDWMGSTGYQIWLSGIPGAGKTILCGTVVEEILQEQTSSTAVAFFFCDYKSTESQKPANILAALAVQLAKQADAAFEVLESYHQELHPHNRIGKPPDTKRMIEVVQEMIKEYDRVYLAIDGIDECGSNAIEVLQATKQIAKNNQVNVALFSRNEPDIMEELAHSARIEIAAHTEDLELYVLAQMGTRKRLGGLAVKNPDLHEHIRRTLIEGANGMFRWVACQLDHLDSLPNDARRRKALTELPPTLFETYDRILDRIMQDDEYNQEICRKALHLIGLGDKNIDPKALCEAISISDNEDVIDNDQLVEPEWISRSCSSLIRLAGEENSHPHYQFAHFTVKEYLRSLPPQSTRILFKYSEEAAIRELLGSSLRFLTFPVFNRKPTIATSEIQRMAERNEQHPFYPVAASSMFSQLEVYLDDKLSEELSLLLKDESMMRYAMELFNPEKSGMFLTWVLQAMSPWPSDPLDTTDFSRIVGILLAPELSTLHIAAMLALPSVCAHLIDIHKVDVNVCCRLGTPLHALLAGVHFLYTSDSEYDPSIHFRSHSKSTSAANDQSRRCLEILLEHGADTSLRWGTTTVLQMAINNSIQTKYNKFWIEPLISASTVVTEDCLHDFKEKLAAEAIDRSTLDAIFTLGSHPDIAPGWARLASLIQTWRMKWKYRPEEGDHLLDIKTRISDEDFLDGIRISISQGLTDTLRAFVQDSRFLPDMRIHNDYSEPVPILHFAIKKGSLRSVEMLLEAGCDPQGMDEDDRWTPLHECACNRTDAADLTALLIKSGAVDTSKTLSGDTCWHLAAEAGNLPVLKVLIDIGSDTKQSLATTSKEGRTPLASAILNGEIGSALLLLDQCHAELDVFQSDKLLLDKAAAIGSEDLFLRLHRKMKEVGAVEAISSSKPFENIDMSSPPKLVDYLLRSWDLRINERSTGLTNYLLDANRAFFEDPNNYPSHYDMDHIIRGLLPSSHVFVHDENGNTCYWEIFCEKVVPYFTHICDHEKSQCRGGLITMIFEILICIEVLASYERITHLSGYMILFRALLKRGNHLKCSWIAPSVHEVIEAQSLPADIHTEAVSTELLTHAVRQSNIDLARELLNHGLNVHAAHGSLSPLEHACYSSDLPMFEMIVERSDKTLINRNGSRGKTLLHWVVSGYIPGYLKKIERLLQLGANIDSEVDDPQEDTALTLASRTYRQDIFELLVSMGANSLHRGRDGWSILHAASITGDFRFIQHLIPSETPESFWMGTSDVYSFPLESIVTNSTAIHVAALEGNSRFLERLIQKKIPFDVNAKSGYLEFAPLHFASWLRHLEVVEILISSKADVNLQDAYGRRPIDIASNRQCPEIIKVLLDSGSESPSNQVPMSCTADSDSTGDSEVNPPGWAFETAIVNGQLDVCQRLADEGHSTNDKLPSFSYTPLVYAVIERQTAIVDWLVSIGVEVSNPVVARLPPALRCIASLSTNYFLSAQTLTAVLSLALGQNLSWYGSIVGPLHVAILDDNIEALDVVLSHIRNNEHVYRKMIDNEVISLPADANWHDRSALSILANEINHQDALYGQPHWPSWPPGTPLHWAVRDNNISAVKLLLQNEADMNEADSLGQTPLYLAVESRHPPALLKELLRAGAAIAEPSRCRINAMHVAIGNGDLEVVKLLAEADPETLKSSDLFSTGFILQIAGSAEVFQYLVSQGADPFNLKEFRSSAVTAHMRPTSLLRGFIFNSGLVSDSAEEPLTFQVASAAYASDPGSIRFIKKLSRSLSIGVFANLINCTKYGIGSPLCMAASANRAGMVETLIAMGAELDLEGCRYGSALMAACAWGCLDVVRCLVRSGAALSYVNKDGLPRSAVNLSSRHEKVVRWLLVDRQNEQRKLEHQPSKCNSQQAVRSGPRLFKLALPAYLHRDFGESRWGHLRRLQKWKEGLLGSTLAESRRNSGLDFKAELEVESRKNEAQAARHRFLARLGEE